MDSLLGATPRDTCFIMQNFTNFTPIGTTVAEISVTKNRTQK